MSDSFLSLVLLCFLLLSGWLEYFAGGRQARALEPALEEIESLLVPAISVYEVFKVLLREAGEEAAIQGVAAMQRGRIIDLTVQRLATFRGYAAGRPVGQNAP